MGVHIKMRPFVTLSLLLPLVAVSSGAQLPGSSQQITKWSAFKAEHDKSHAGQEELSRFQRFIERDAEIEAHNERFAKGLESFEKKHTQYSDLSSTEFKKMALGFVAAVNETEIPFAEAMPAGPGAPAAFDWRNQNIVTPVRNQLYCGSCYAFAGSAVMESYLLAKHRMNVDLSEQDVVDCSYKKHGFHNNGCEGGWPTAVFDHYFTKDIITEAEYCYTSGKSQQHGACKIPNAKQNVFRGKFRAVNVRPRTEQELAEILYQKGPLAIAMVADNEHKANFMDVGNTIFDQPHTCSINPNHAVVLVGYGTERGKDFWVIKNSWGTTWGVGGYGRISRGNNMCNIMKFGVWYVE